MDFIDEDQELYGYRTLNLLTSNADPTLMRQVIFHYISGQYYPALKANFVRVVINGELWGIYINMQQFNTDFTNEEFGSKKVPAGKSLQIWEV